jgi:RNA polymerase sigma-70 factor (ECF subfamily)
MSHFLGWVSELARTHSRGLLAVARHEGLTASDALDAVQEAYFTFLGLPQARGLAGEQQDAEALMAVLVRNAARNMRRRHHRARPHEAIDAAERLISDEPSVDELIVMAEAHVGLLGCVNQLGEIQRHVVKLRLLDEVAPDSTAQTLGLTEGNVAVLLHRAKKELRACLSRADGVLGRT